MLNTPQNRITEILDNIAMSCRMEGLELTDEMRAMCLAIYNGSITVQDNQKAAAESAHRHSRATGGRNHEN